MKIYKMLKFFFTKKKGVTRVEVLKKAKDFKSDSFGLCYAICAALSFYNIPSCGSFGMELLFPLFRREKAYRFGASICSPYWWPAGKWDTGREDFLNWLIEKYKYDTTDLKELVKKLEDDD